MAGINAAMTALFVRSLRRLPSLQATVLSTAANMAATVSGVVGYQQQQLPGGDTRQQKQQWPLQYQQQQKQPAQHCRQRSDKSECLCRLGTAAAW
jgi:hypothetical protein